MVQKKSRRRQLENDKPDKPRTKSPFTHRTPLLEWTSNDTVVNWLRCSTSKYELTSGGVESLPRLGNSPFILQFDKMRLAFGDG